jgi:hypothetical protein
MSNSFARRLFFAFSLVVTGLASYGYLNRARIFRPDPCICREVFSGDSSTATHAARRIAGNGYYVFTIAAGQRACVSAYEQLSGTSSGVDMPDARQQRHWKAYFDSTCIP